MKRHFAVIVGIFNILAGAASLGGLYVGLVVLNGKSVPPIAEYDPRVLIVICAIALALSIYVLFVPQNVIERNVSAKLRHYRYPQSGTKVTFQEGEFTYVSIAMLPIAFECPFASPPTVELIQIGGDPKIYVEPQNISTHQFDVVCTSEIFSLSEPGKYRWIAKGTLLEEIRN